MRAIFDKLSSAKIVVEGAVVPNLIVTRQRVNGLPGELSKNFGKECYTLSFITAENKIYQVDFDSFFFQANHTIHVNGPLKIDDIDGSARAFDLVSNMKAPQNGAY